MLFNNKENNLKLLVILYQVISVKAVENIEP